MNLSLKVIASSSSGNCTLLWGSPGALLIDCGLPMRYTLKNMLKKKVSLKTLSGVLMTHSHSDHIKGPMVKKLLGEKVPLFCHFNTEKQFVGKFGMLKRNHITSFGHGRFKAGDYIVEPFEVDHDSQGCYGFSVYHKNKKATIATDLGPPGKHLVERFKDSDVIVIESNHDTQMLEKSSRPYWLKERIRRSHLSNVECAGFVRKVISASEKKPSAVVLAHLSSECNTSLLAEKCMRQAVEGAGLNIPVLTSFERESVNTVNF